MVFGPVSDSLDPAPPTKVVQIEPNAFFGCQFLAVLGENAEQKLEELGRNNHRGNAVAAPLRVDIHRTAHISVVSHYGVGKPSPLWSVECHSRERISTATMAANIQRK